MVAVYYDREQKLIYASADNGIYVKKFNETEWKLQDFHRIGMIFMESENPEFSMVGMISPVCCRDRSAPANL